MLARLAQVLDECAAGAAGFLEGVGQDRLLVPAAGGRLAPAQQQVRADAALALMTLLDVEFLDGDGASTKRSSASASATPEPKAATPRQLQAGGVP